LNDTPVGTSTVDLSVMFNVLAEDSNMVGPIEASPTCVDDCGAKTVRV
jgi:hypothetical protein